MVVGGGLQFGGLRILSLLFADDVILVALSVCDLQHTVDQFAAECEAAGMRINTSKSEAMVKKLVYCPLQVRNESLPQVKEIKYLSVLLTSEGTMEQEIGCGISVVGAVLHLLYYNVVTKRELGQKAKLLIYWLIFVSSLIYGHEGWIMTETMRLQIQKISGWMDR